MCKGIKEILEEIKFYDIQTYEHSLNVCQIGKIIAMKNGFNKSEIEFVEAAGLMHDCGKLMVDKKILSKPGKLTDEEFKQIKYHPSYSAMIIMNRISGCELLADVVMEHHERNDGSGYPYNKRKIQIFETAKIISIADSYDAMKSERCYKSKMEDFDIINEFVRCKNMYEEKYLNTMIELIKEHSL